MPRGALGIVAVRKSAAELRFIRETARALRRSSPKARIVVGETLDDDGLIRIGNLHVTGALAPDELPRLIRLYRLGSLVAGIGAPLFGHPMIFRGHEFGPAHGLARLVGWQLRPRPRRPAHRPGSARRRRCRRARGVDRRRGTEARRNRARTAGPPARQNRRSANRRRRQETAMSAIAAAATLDPPEAQAVIAGDVREPLDTRAAVKRARELREEGLLAEAEEVIQGVLAVDPDHVAALVELGHVERTGGDFSGAVAAFQAAAKAEPDHLGLRVEIGRHLRLAARTDEAELMLAELIAEGHANVGAFIEYGHCLRARGDRVGALDAYERAAAIDPAHAGVTLERAAELRVLGRNGEAEALLRALLSAAPENNAGMIALGYLLIETNRPAEAEHLLMTVRRADPKNGRIALTLAMLAGQRSDHAAAIDQLGEALAAEPGDLDIRLALAAAFREQERHREAGDLLRAAPCENEHAPALQIELSRLKRAEGDRRCARTILKRALESEPDHPGLVIAAARSRPRSRRPGGTRSSSPGRRSPRIQTRSARIFSAPAPPPRWPTARARQHFSARLDRASARCRK